MSIQLQREPGEAGGAKSWTQVDRFRWTYGRLVVRGGYADGNCWRAFDDDRLIVASSDMNFVRLRCEMEHDR